MSENKKILFFSPYSGPWAWKLHTQVDAVVASALRLRGCEVLVIGCDGVYKNCYITRGGGSQEIDVCQICSQAGKDYFSELFQLPYVQLQDFITANDYIIANQWIETITPEDYANSLHQELPIGKWVTSSIYTYFRISTVGLSRPEVRKVHKQYLIEGLLTFNAVSRLLDTYKPTNLFLFGARLAPYRIAFEAARQRQIDVIVQENGYIYDSYTLFDNCTCLNPEPVLNLVSAWETTPLTNSELVQTKQYFIEREAGQNINFPSFYEYKTDYKDVRSQLRIPADARIVSVFTSSEDELAMSEDHAEITGQLDIIDRLIEIFAERDEYLIIRHHPYIAGQKLVQAETNLLLKAYQKARSAPKNVRIVMPSEQLTSYALLWQTDATIAFLSTIAVESLARGIPTAALKASVYQKILRYGIGNLDRESLTILVDSLLSESAQPTIEDFRKLYRFTYAYFFRFSNIFRSFGTKGLRFETLEDLEPGVDSVLDRVCDRIMYGSSLYDLPSQARKSISLLEEDGFLNQELVEVRDYRQQVRDQTIQTNSTVANLPLGVIYLKYQSDEKENQPSPVCIERSRYENIVVHSCSNLDWADYQYAIDSVIAITEVISEEYISIRNSYTQYDESFASTAMDILLADENHEIKGVLFGGWLPFNQSLMEAGIFTKQEIFTHKEPAPAYQNAIEILPLLQHPLTLLSFCLIRKDVIVEILKAVRRMPTMTQTAEGLFTLLNSYNIHKTGLPMIVIHKIPESFKKNLRNQVLAALKDELKLRDINLILFPDWSQSEDSLFQDLASVIRATATHPDRNQIALLVDTSNVSDEEANFILSSVAMNLMMQEDLDVTNGPEISLVGKLRETHWQTLLPCLHSRIILENENKQAIVEVGADRIPFYELDSLPLFCHSKQKKISNPPLKWAVEQH